MAITERALKLMVAAIEKRGTKFQLFLVLFFIIIVAVVFSVHIVMGSLLPMLQQSGYENHIILESFLTVVLIGPFIWGFIVKRKRAEERLSKLNECFMGFGTNPLENINRLTALCGELLGANCALYNRLDKGMLCSWGQWNAPPGYNPGNIPQGHICYDVINRGNDEIIVINNLPETSYAHTDPNVIQYKLKTYIGVAVKFGNDYVGSLCALYHNDFLPSEDDRKFISLIASAIGIEEIRRHAEEAQRESEQRYRSLAESAHDMIFIIDSDDRVEYINKFGAESLGCRPEEIIGKPRENIFPLDISSRQKTVLQKVIETGKPNYVEGITPFRDCMVWLSTWLVPLRDGAGKVKSVLGISRDITERKQAVEKLKESETRLAEAQRIAHIGSWEHNLETNEFFNSEEACRLLEATPDELTSLEEFLTRIHPEDKEFIRKSIEEAIRGKGKLDYEYRIILKDGSVRVIHAQGEASFDSTGKPLKISGTAMDITERKKTEKVRIENARLAYASKAKSEFLANMSHELRTPLNSVIGFSELLKEKKAGELNEKQEHYANNILTSSKFLLDLINDILDLSKVEAGKIELVIETIPVVQTINETINLIKEKAMKHNVVIKTEFDPQLDFIEADRQRFKQVLFNLLSNAIKFSKKEGGTVTITAKKGENMAKISVSDTGIGIKEEDMGRLFNEFEQLDSGISRKYGGTGLGLAISKKLVEQNGGEILVESRDGEGSTFTFTLPLMAIKH